MTFQELNRASTEAASEALERCCGSARWVECMVKGRPWHSEDALLDSAARVWNALHPEDWLEAFSKHPKIGARATTTPWSEAEQSGMLTASASTEACLRETNARYEEKFGWIFIVCATGKSADEMLAILRQRMHNDRATELHVAAHEQAQITAVRLKKLFAAA